MLPAVLGCVDSFLFFYFFSACEGEDDYGEVDGSPSAEHRARLAPLYRTSALALLLQTMDPYLEIFSSLRCHHAAPLVLHGGHLGQQQQEQNRRKEVVSLAQKVSPLAPLEVPPSSQTASGLPREWISRYSSQSSQFFLQYPNMQPRFAHLLCCRLSVNCCSLSAFLCLCLFVLARRLVGSTEMLTSMNDEIRVQLQLLYSQYLCRFFPKRPLVRVTVDRAVGHLVVSGFECP